MTYTKNNETGKLELRFLKSDYMALPQEKKAEIKSTFLWSNFAGAWVSRAKDPNLYRAVELAKALGMTYEGETGEKLAFSEQVEREQDKAADRADRMNSRATKAVNESSSQYQRAHEIGSHIPFGQPILVGHHSEGRHRRDLDKIDNAMRKSCEAQDKAEHYEQRAEAAEYTASGAKFKNVNYLLNRIAECKKELRAIERGLQGKDLYNRETGQMMKDGCEISDARRERLEAKKPEWIEKLDFFTGKLNEIGGGQLTTERLKEARPMYVKVGAKWWPLKSINRDTVTVLNWLDIAHATWKFKFDKIKAMEAGYTTVVLDRDGNEVKPTIKYK